MWQLTAVSIAAAGKDTTLFRTPDASGSTSQAANIQEALELGATALLLDEDVCATNFMIRDARMQVQCSLSPDLTAFTLPAAMLAWHGSASSSQFTSLYCNV